MYPKIMVPLDGSELAESVLPHVEGLVKCGQTRTVVFVRNVEPYYIPTGADYLPPREEMQRIEQEMKTATKDYLKKLLSRFKHDAVEFKAEILHGSTAENLVDFAEKGSFDLVVIATHGRSGVSRFFWGSVADRILRGGTVPVLMIRPPGCILPA